MALRKQGDDLGYPVYCCLINHRKSISYQSNICNICISYLLTVPYPLSGKGKKAAEVVAEDFQKNILENRTIDRLIVSPLVRATETAEPFSRTLSVPVEHEPRLMEQHIGRFSGMKYSELNHQPDYEHRKDKRWNWVPEGDGESYEMIAERVKSFFTDVEKDYASILHSSSNHKTFLCITHGVTLRLIYGLLENSLPEYPSWLAHNGEVWEVSFKGVGINHNIVRHFPGDSDKTLHRA
ncbi:MAG: histidine phosphatase family protein [Bacteroidetes bacterium]|nr:histidine phosphatase family protein [Bacteroidota bacterium]